jgi:hypothetical protein
MSNTTQYIVKINNLPKAEKNVIFNKLINKDSRLNLNSIKTVPSDLIFSDDDITPEIKKALHDQMSSISTIKMLIIDLRKTNSDLARKADNYADRYLRDNERNYGCIDEYDWKEKNWGVEYEPEATISTVDKTDCILKFSTYGMINKDILLELGKSNTNIEFEISYANEDIGRDCGFYILKGADIVSQDVSPARGDPDYSYDDPKWNALAFGVLYPGKNPHDLGFDEDQDFGDYFKKSNENKKIKKPKNKP